MDYKRHYDLLIEKGLQRVSCTEYTEKHHILPKCLGGTEDPLNTVILTGREHFVAHWLLHRIYPNHKGLSKAFHAMATMQRPNCGRYVPSSRAVAESREAFNKQQMREVHQYSLEGDYIKTFESIKEAARSIDKTPGNISTLLNGRKDLHSVGGYQWSRVKAESLGSVKRIHNAKKKKVEKRTLEGDLVDIFDSVSDAAKSVNAAAGHISVVLNNYSGRKSARGYKWNYA